MAGLYLINPLRVSQHLPPHDDGICLATAEYGFSLFGSLDTPYRKYRHLYHSFNALSQGGVKAITTGRRRHNLAHQFIGTATADMKSTGTGFHRQRRKPCSVIQFTATRQPFITRQTHGDGKTFTHRRPHSGQHFQQ